MTKYTKRQYLADVAANEAEAKLIAAEIASFQTMADAGACVVSMTDAWNAAFDRQSANEEARKWIEVRFRQRNWGYQDHAHSALVSMNAD